MQALKELFVVLLILGLAAAVAAGREPNVVRPSELHNEHLTIDSPSGVRPGRPDQDIPQIVLKHAPDALKKMVNRLHEARHAYQGRQKDLLKEAKGATDEEKEAIRDQLKENRENFLDRTQNLRREVHKRVHELRDKLKDRREVIDAARDENRDDTRERRAGTNA